MIGVDKIDIKGSLPDKNQLREIIIELKKKKIFYDFKRRFI